MAIERRDGYWLWIGGPVTPGASAVTFGPMIAMRRDAADDAHLLRHELVHVEQFRRHGVIVFVTRYLAGYVRGRWARYPHWSAYRRIPFEIEAEWRARRAGIDARV